MTKVAVIDYGMGNLHSVVRALGLSGAGNVVLTGNASEIASADRVVFPGQGAIGSCLLHLNEMELKTAVLDAVKNKPFLGICLGQQALFDFSEEDGGTAALGILPGRVCRFPDAAAPTGGRLKVPHMGWNQVAKQYPHPLWAGIDDYSWFYFVHSYYVRADNSDHVAGISQYGKTAFCAAAARENVFAIQFHPEKSHRVGLALLANFIQWDGEFKGEN